VLGASIPLITSVYGYLPKPLFAAPGARTLMREWARFARTGEPPFPIAQGVATPTLDIHLEGDRYAVAAANDAFVSHLIQDASLTRWLYRRQDVPEGGSNHHIGWVRFPAPVVARIVNWWNSSSAPAPRSRAR